MSLLILILFLWTVGEIIGKRKPENLGQQGPLHSVNGENTLYLQRSSCGQGVLARKNLIF